jgi:hypothetical protein
MYHDVDCPSPRKARFRPLVKRYRTGFYPQGSIERFSTHFMFVVPPFPSFLAQSPESNATGIRNPPLLNYMDRAGVTRRVGNTRFPRNR